MPNCVEEWVRFPFQLWNEVNNFIKLTGTLCHRVPVTQILLGQI